MIQGTNEWKAMRRGKIGASDAPVIMGASPWTTPYQLWQTKLGLREDKPDNWAMKRGRELEEPARREFERLTGLIVVPQVLQHSEYDWMIASLDGLSFDGNEMVEIKCAGREDHQCALDGEVPAKYIPQLQHQLEVSSLDMGYYFSFDGQLGKVIKIYRDDKYIADLLKKEIAFWECLQSFEAPKIDPQRDYTHREDDSWVKLAGEWDLLLKDQALMDSREKDLKHRLIESCGGLNTMGSGLTVQRVVRKGTVDYQSIPELQGVDLEAYRKGPSESWRITNR